VQKAGNPVVSAATYVRMLLESGVVRDGEKFPPVKSLALSARVGPAAMVQALHDLQKEGLVYIRRKKGVFAGKPAPQPHPKGTVPVWKRIKNEVQEAIFQGKFAGNRLPSLREFQRTYGAGFVNIRKAIDALNSEGIIKKGGRASMISSMVKNPGHAAILLVLPSHTLDIMRIINQREEEGLKAITAQCARRGINVQRAPFQRAPDSTGYFRPLYLGIRGPRDRNLDPSAYSDSRADPGQ
jgi:DNA-binding transcriptional regulator YhcF (GntR family)